MSETKKPEVTYSVSIMRIEEGIIDEVKVEGYGILQEALDDIETMIEERGWQIDGDEDVE